MFSLDRPERRGTRWGERKVGFGGIEKQLRVLVETLDRDGKPRVTRKIASTNFLVRMKGSHNGHQHQAVSKFVPSSNRSLIP